MSVYQNVYVGAYIELTNCGKEVEKTKTVRYCPNGHSKNINGKFCPECGSQIIIETKNYIEIELRSVVGQYYEWEDEMNDVGRFGVELEEGTIVLIANHSGDFRIKFNDYQTGIFELSNTEYMIEALKERYKAYIEYLTVQGFDIEYKIGAIGYCS